MSTKTQQICSQERTDLAVLHHVSLPQPGLVEWFARSVDYMTQPILFGQYEHSIKQTFHRAGGLYQSGARNRK